MNKTIIFISGWQVPKVVAKSKFVWDQDHWPNYRRLFLPSRTPTSDNMVEKELDRLQYLLTLFPEAILAGQSLGGWWAANLALRPDVLINKLVLWTPLGNANAYPIFNVSPRYHPTFQRVNPHNKGPHRVLVCYGKHDLVVPPFEHSDPLVRHFDALTYKLDGGHLYQSNHKAALNYMKDWAEID